MLFLMGRKRFFRPLFALCPLLLGLVPLGCGEGASNSFEVSSSPSTLDADISGNFADEIGTDSSLLVFAYKDLPQDIDPARREPLSVGIVGPDGTFGLSSPPAHKLTIVFLADAANDGVIDRGDQIAILLDPDQQLSNLQQGDQVQLSDLRIDFSFGRAVADSIEVVRGTNPGPAPTVTPIGSAG